MFLGIHIIYIYSLCMFVVESLVSGNVEGGKRENNGHTLDLWRDFPLFLGQSQMGTWVRVKSCQKIGG